MRVACLCSKHSQQHRPGFLVVYHTVLVESAYFIFLCARPGRFGDMICAGISQELSREFFSIVLEVDVLLCRRRAAYSGQPVGL